MCDIARKAVGFIIKMIRLFKSYLRTQFTCPAPASKSMYFFVQDERMSSVVGRVSGFMVHQAHHTDLT
jgi:hypothetical protein